MKRWVLAALFAVLLLAGCVIAPGPPGYEVEVAPPLPAIIELDVEPYYFQGGYYYYYHDSRWDYSRSRRGPWLELPRSHWPREIRRKGMEEHRDREFMHEHGHEGR